MTEESFLMNETTVLAFDLKVICANEEKHENVELRVVDQKVSFVTSNGAELKGENAVTFIDGGNFLTPVHHLERAIVRYRSQK